MEGGRKREREKDKEKVSIYRSIPQIPNGLNTLGSARQKPGAENFI